MTEVTPVSLEYQSPSAKLVFIDRVAPSGWNPRTIKRDRFLNLCRSIAADPSFLWHRPVLAQGDGEIYAGNMRWRAVKYLWEKGTPANPSRKNLASPPIWAQQASEAGIEPGTIPAIVEDVPELVAKERAMRDNAAWGEWQEDQLSEVVFNLQAMGSDLSILGFDDKELAALLAASGASGESGVDAGAVEPPVDPLVRTGDLWKLGDHRLVCGDCSKSKDVARLMDDSRAALVMTDPPYGIDYAAVVDGRVNQRAGGWEDITGDSSVDPDALYAMLTDAFTAARDLALDPNAAWFVWHPPLENREIFRRALNSVGVKVRKEIVWTKPRIVFGRLEYHWQHEPCMYGWGAGRPEFYGDRSESTLWQVEFGPREEVHPTRKPVELWGRAMRNHTQKGDGCFDGFAGSGPCLIAAEQLGRTAYVMDIEPGFCDAMLERWARMTGQDPVRDDGVTWSLLRENLPEMQSALPIDDDDDELPEDIAGQLYGEDSN